MAITYKFTTLTNGVNIEVFNGATQIADRNIVGSSTALVQKDFQDGTPISITVSVPEALYGNVFNLAGNTFIFDDVTVTGADNIQDAISAFFHKANTGSGGTGVGGGGLTLEIYQNSAMSAPVQAYVFRDADGNIMRVYEPVRNNDVSRYQFAYADSIDRVPFDKIDCFDNRMSDAKLENFFPDVVIQGATLENCVIKCGKGHSFQVSSISETSFLIDGDQTSLFPADKQFYIINTNDNNGFYTVISSSIVGESTMVDVGYIGGVGLGKIVLFTSEIVTGLKIFNISIKGNYGIICPNNAEIFVSGNGVFVEAINMFGEGNFIDAIGDQSQVFGLTISNDNNGIKFNNVSGAYVHSGTMWEDNTYIHLHFDGTIFYDFSIGGGTEIFLGDGDDQGGFFIGDFVQIGDRVNRYKSISNLSIGTRTYIYPTTDNTDNLNYVETGLNFRTFESSGDMTNQIYRNIGGTKYRLGVADGVVTATPV